MRDNKGTLLPANAITPSLMSAYVASEQDKHSECRGHCRHTREAAEKARILAEAFDGCPEMQQRVDQQLEMTFRHGQQSGDLANSLRTFGMSMIEQGWELARFALEGKGDKGMVQ